MNADFLTAVVSAIARKATAEASGEGWLQCLELLRPFFPAKRSADEC